MARASSRIRSVGLKALLSAVGGAGALLLLEALLRVYNPFYVRIKGDRVVLTGNRRLTFINRINPKLDPIIRVTINSLGFRGPDPPADFGRDLTLVTIGGSTTHCLMLSDGTTWTDRLDERLKNSFRRVWMNNAGLDGHSTRGHLALLEDHIIPLHPKVALFMIGGNDMVAAKLNKYEVEVMKGSIQFGSPRLFLKSLSPYSEVATLLLDLYRSRDAWKVGFLTYQYVDLAKVAHVSAPEKVREEFIRRNTGPNLSAYESRLRRLVELTRGAGIEPVFITQPVPFGPGTDDVTHVDLSTLDLTRAMLQPVNAQMTWDLLEVYTEATRKVGRENGLLVIDLARLMPKSSRYYCDFWHFTNEGAQMAADLIYNSLCPMLAERFGAYVQRPCECRPPVPCPPGQVIQENAPNQPKSRVRKTGKVPLHAATGLALGLSIAALNAKQQPA